MDDALGVAWDEVLLVEHNPVWAQLFEREADRISQACSPLTVRVEHVGTTAVVGLSAKPVIDLLVGVESVKETLEVERLLCSSGYERSTAKNRGDRLFLWRGRAGKSQYHVNITIIGSDTWTNLTRFRDRLASDPLLTERYSMLKEGLAAKREREDYTVAKSSFVAEALRSN